MDKIAIKADRRASLGKKVKQLRRAGITPAILYGRNIEPVPLAMDSRELSGVLRAAGGTRLIELQLDDGDARTVLAREVQHNVLTQSVVHVDFYEVIMTERITAEVPIVLTGEAPAVEQAEGILMAGVSSVQVESLPGDLPDEIRVDLSGLAQIDDSIFVGELSLAGDARILTDAEELVAKILAPRREEAVVAEVEAPEFAEEMEARADEDEAATPEGGDEGD